MKGPRRRRRSVRSHVAPLPGRTEIRSGNAAAPEWRLWALWAVAVFPICWRQITTSDLWWHIALGRWLARQWSAPDFSAFYFTPVNQSVPDLRWTALGDILLWAVHALGGNVAIQILAFGCTALGCALLRGLRPGPMNGWMTAVLVAVAIGTYQLQLPRNALFSLPFTALIFWLFARYRTTRGKPYLWLLPATLALWSVMHGSYLLGSILIALLLGVDTVEGVVRSRGEGWHRMKRTAVVLAVILGISCVGNPAATRMLRRPIEHVVQVGKSQPTKTEDGSLKAGKLEEKASANAPAKAKEWLNNLIWPEVPGQVRSADFSSPLDRTSYRPVIVAFMLMALAAAWALWSSPPPWPWIAAFLATSLLGLSYFRMTGYASLGSAALILASGKLRGPVAEALGRSSWMGAALAAIVAAVMWGGLWMGNLPRVLGNSRHVVAVGKSPTFDDNACRWLVDHFPDAPTFTTIVTGSYALERWQGRKRVFIDGFFAPHPAALWRDYVRARRTKDRDLLREKYGVELALIEHTRRDWNSLFLNQPNWQPIAIGSGCVIYGHRSLTGDAKPQLLCSPSEVDQLPTAYRRAFARNYYGAVLALLAAERLDAARTLVAAAPEGYRRWRKWVAPAEARVIAQMDPVLDPQNDSRQLPGPD